MTTTIEYLDAMKSKLGAVSDYDLGKKMSWGPSRISNYRTKNSFFDDETCLKVASILELPEIEVLLNVHAERSPNPVIKASFKQVLKQLATTAAVCLITTGLNLVNPSPAYAASVVPTSNNYTLCVYLYIVDCHITSIFKLAGFPRIYRDFVECKVMYHPNSTLGDAICSCYQPLT